MKLKKTIWIHLVCVPVLLTAIIIPPIVIHKQKQNKINNNKKPGEQNLVLMKINQL
ncbi:hypothetical protein MFERI15181_00552 [Mycoplasma feriruminatoris]|uniref:Uncharacterized protein n=1 Tax=Mycoplasma feriruminatoris TaxID=1179777 RepID=A0ABY8HVI1_9MOLU|nr:hypothetical protein [Mycoplasma feriruminatoris]WFQ93634.1 hypothetical protein MFERI15181_00552 [Mycoplasma feriruminatoris]